MTGMLHSYKGVLPTIDPSAFIAPGAHIVGNVTIGRESSVWFNAVIRGDINSISIGDRSNVQDNCVLHVINNEYPLTIGSGVTVGHGAILHACAIGDGCLIGMGALVIDGAVVGNNSLVAAGSLVKMRQVIPEGVLAAGSPAKIIRPLSPEEIAAMRQTALNYVGYTKGYALGPAVAVNPANG
jgi:carbonic anhydrase/acetyltransferase-like protein (isoleucine patch superfamily)